MIGSASIPNIDGLLGLIHILTDEKRVKSVLGEMKTLQRDISAQAQAARDKLSEAEKLQQSFIGKAEDLDHREAFVKKSENSLKLRTREFDLKEKQYNEDLQAARNDIAAREEAVKNLLAALPEREKEIVEKHDAAEAALASALALEAEWKAKLAALKAAVNG